MNDIELYDLYDVWYQPWWQHWSVKIIGLSLLFLVVAGAIWSLVRRFTRAAAVPYWQRALDQCSSLKAQLDQLEPPVIYAQLITILKTYIAARYIHTTRSATEKELMIIIQELAISDVQKSHLKQLLMQAVPVKFATEKPGLQVITADIDALQGFINTTRPADTT